jgi:non-specific serine/threonine protein kinase/serine/threonine-protein kinase
VQERWARVKEILHEAVELPEGERSAYVQKAAGTDESLALEVESLLESFRDAEDFLEEAPVQLGGFGDALEGRWIGEYRIQRLIARGGMGSVYEATKDVDEIPLRVAVKIIRFASTTPYLIRRFKLERQILARLQSEYILRLLDGGVTSDGLPYLVTEFVDGQNLQEWLERSQPSLAERLNLFLRICEGVSTAHRSLIVHGDLRPSNILVTTNGVPKLLDFGIARLMSTQGEGDEQDGAMTVTMAPALTPWWASPEQLRGEPLSIDCDCYELGRILFFLLTGKTAFDFSGMGTSQILEHLQREAPPKPSAFSGNNALAGDLDNITRKALEYEAIHRYRSVDALAEDVQRHLDLRPVSARPYTVGYRFERFVRRNRALVLALGCATLAVAGALGVALYQANEARKNYESSQLRNEQLRRLANSLVFETDDSLVQLPGATPVRAKLVRSALQYLDELARQETQDAKLKEELAAAYEKIGDIQGRPGSQNLGLTAASLDSYRKAEAIRESLRRMTKDPKEFQLINERLATTYARISAGLRAVGDTNGGLLYERKALGIRERLYEDNPQDLSRKRALASSLTTLSGSLSQMGDWAGVLDTRREALKMHEELVASNPQERGDRRALALALARMGSIEMHEGNLDSALGRYRRALEIEAKLLAEDPGNVQYQLSYAWAQNNLGGALAKANRLPEAMEEFRRAIQSFTAVVSTDDQDVRGRTLLQTARVNASKSLTRLGRASEGLRMALLALEDRERLSRANVANAGALGEVAEAHFAVGLAQAGLGQNKSAAASYVAAYRILRILQNEGRENFAMREVMAEIAAALARVGGSVPEGLTPDSSSGSPTPKTTQ